MWRVIENPVNKRQGLTSAASQYFLNPAKTAEKELTEAPDAEAEPEPVKLEETAPTTPSGTPFQPGPTPEPAKGGASETAPELQPPDEVNPAPVDTRPEGVKPIGRLPDVLPESRPASLLSAKQESQPQEPATAQAKMPVEIQNPPAPVLDSKPSSPPAVVQAKYETLPKEATPAQTNSATITLPAPMPMPVVTVPKVGPSQPTGRPGHPSELNVHVQQESPARKIILIPQAPEKSQSEPEPPKAAKIISVEGKPAAAAEGGKNSKPAREYPRQPPALERAPVKVIQAFPEIIQHSQPQIRSMVTNPEPPSVSPPSVGARYRGGDGRIADPANNLGRPRKLPASVTDSPLVLGPACELLEATKVAETSAPSTTPETRVSTGVIILSGAPEKTIAAKTQPYLENWLKDYIRTACGGLAERLEITLHPGNRLQVHFRVKNDADVESLGRKIMDLPELAPYRVSLDITVSP
jgi:hypothetical protein